MPGMVNRRKQDAMKGDGEFLTADYAEDADKGGERKGIRLLGFTV